MADSGTDPIEVNDWEEFEIKLKELRQSLSEPFPRPLLFRGHSNSEWDLDTTLDRVGMTLDGQTVTERIPFTDYYSLIVHKIRPAIETLTGMKWDDLPDSGEIDKALRDDNPFAVDAFPPRSALEYMVYLQHHGFPSPLLDWSHQPYVAAFFAFRESRNREIEKRSIYVFSESGKWIAHGYGPRISRKGPYIRSHRRHFTQHGDYTICGIRRKDEWHFAKHQEVFNLGTKQDVLYKFNIPSTERNNVLRRLDEYNLNAFSLFNTDDTLMETLAFRELESKAAKSSAI